jgi:glycosyltransferase involved in cell wall biosynthesis
LGNIISLSVVIPTYNRGQYIGEAIESVLAQTRPADEIIVVDDGSTDNTEHVLSKYSRYITKYIKQPNSGPAAARNRGVREASGEFIAFLDSDDIWVQNKTEMEMEWFAKNKHLDLVFCHISNFQENDEKEILEIRNPRIEKYLVDNASDLKEIFNCLIGEKVIGTSSGVIVRRSCFDRVGPFDESLRIAEDLDWWLRAARTCRFGFVNAVLVRRRRHPGNLVNDWVATTEAYLRVLRKLATTESNLPAVTKRLIYEKTMDGHYDLGSYFLKKKRFAEAYLHFRQGVPAKLTNGKWAIKFLLAWMMFRWFGR